jgi:hypothetical protein
LPGGLDVFLGKFKKGGLGAPLMAQKFPDQVVGMKPFPLGLAQEFPPSPLTALNRLI